MPDPLNPFTEDDFASIEKALEQGQINEEAIKKATRAGIDLPELLEQNRSVVARLRKIRDTYKPGR